MKVLCRRILVELTIWLRTGWTFSSSDLSGRKKSLLLGLKRYWHKGSKQQQHILVSICEPGSNRRVSVTEIIIEILSAASFFLCVAEALELVGMIFSWLQFAPIHWGRLSGGCCKVHCHVVYCYRVHFESVAKRVQLNLNCEHGILHTQIYTHIHMHTHTHTHTHMYTHTHTHTTKTNKQAITTINKAKTHPQKTSKTTTTTKPLH